MALHRRGSTPLSQRIGNCLLRWHRQPLSPGCPSDGTVAPRYSKVPAWVLTYTGLSLPSFGGAPDTPATVTHELLVLVNAQTGQYMEAYSYR